MSKDHLIIRILDREGGYVNDPLGGPTKFGITMPALSEFRNKAVTKVDIQNLELPEARDLYRKWFTSHGVDLIDNDMLADLYFDCIVNHGPSRGKRWLQEQAGVKVDGIIGKVTANAVNGAPKAIYYKLVGYRIKFYTKLAKINWVKNGPFIEGWINRATSFIKEI